MPMTYLSDEWFAAAGDAFADLPERPGATATIQRVITGTPDGDVAYHLTLDDGRIVGVERGTDDAAQVTLTLPYKDALRVEHGEYSSERGVHAGPPEGGRLDRRGAGLPAGHRHAGVRGGPGAPAAPTSTA